MGCSCLYLSDKNVPKMSVKEHKVKTPVGKRRPLKNSSAHSKALTERPGKGKETESSQGRAQSWWRPLRA